MTDTHEDRRRLLVAISGVGLVAAAASAVPFVASLTPSERARAAGAPVEADVSKLAAGEMMTVEWRGKPVWILRRTPEMLAELETHEKRLADRLRASRSSRITPSTVIVRLIPNIWW